MQYAPKGFGDVANASHASCQQGPCTPKGLCISKGWLLSVPLPLIPCLPGSQPSKASGQPSHVIFLPAVPGYDPATTFAATAWLALAVVHVLILEAHLLQNTVLCNSSRITLLSQAADLEYVPVTVLVATAWLAFAVVHVLFLEAHLLQSIVCCNNTSMILLPQAADLEHA